MCADFKQKLEDETDFYIVYKDGKQDKTRLLIRHKDSVDYNSIDQQLRFMGVQTEFSSQLGLLLMPSIMTIQEDFDRLLDALKKVTLHKVDQVFYKIFRLEQAIPIREAFLQQDYPLSYQDAVGHIVTEYIIPYPPGSPVIVPGEIMSQELADYLDNFEGNIVGLEHEGYVNVLDKEE